MGDIASFQETNTLNELKPASEEKRTLSSDDDDEHFKDIHFPPDSALQQVSLIHILFISLYTVTLSHFLSLSLIFINFLPLILQGWAGTAKAKEDNPKIARNSKTQQIQLQNWKGQYQK